MKKRTSVRAKTTPGTYRQRGYKRTGASFAAAQAARRQIIPLSRGGAELKYFDAVKTDTAIGSSWTGGEYDPAANCLGVPTQGNGASSRVGTKITVKSLQVQGRVWRALGSDQADSRTPTLVQIALVMDTQTNGTQLNAEDVYTATDPEVPGYRVIANTSRFKVLRTQTFNMQDVSAFNDAAATGSIVGNAYCFQWFIKMNQLINFIDSAGAGAVADIKDVSFHMIGCCSGTANVDRLEYNFRMRYLD